MVLVARWQRDAQAGRDGVQAGRNGHLGPPAAVPLTRVAATRIEPAAAVTIPARGAASGAARPGPRWCGR
jgi:hypothetical protein